MVKQILLLLSLLCLINLSYGDDGLQADFQRCIDFQFPGISRTCVTFKLNSCQKSFYLTLTYGSQKIIEESISDFSQNEICRTIQIPNNPFTCYGCVKFTDLQITTSYAHMCPAFNLRCGPTNLASRQLECFSIGQNCPIYTTCSSCNSQSRCGWCDYTGKCAASGENGPYCDNCTRNWIEEIANCPTIPLEDDHHNAATASRAELGLMVGLPVVLGSLFLLGVLYFVVRRRSKKVRYNYPVRLQDDVEARTQQRTSVSINGGGGGEREEFVPSHMTPLRQDDRNVPTTPTIVNHSNTTTNDNNNNNSNDR